MRTWAAWLLAALIGVLPGAALAGTAGDGVARPGPPGFAAAIVRGIPVGAAAGTLAAAAGGPSTLGRAATGARAAAGAPAAADALSAASGVSAAQPALPVRPARPPGTITGASLAAQSPGRGLPVPARQATASPPRITADAAVLLDAATGSVLWATHADVPRAPASTTKIMTALLALELGNPDDLVTISRRAADTPGSSSRLRAGERIPLGELLKGLLLRSGNDAAVAIAEHLAGSTDAFAELMNARAAQLGLRRTHFTNPHGLTQAGHYASAYDLALLARAAMAYPAFAAIVRTPVGDMAGLSPGDRSFVRRLHNTNRLLLTYDWVDGVKTGTTAAAGSCLVASGNRNGQRLIAVVLHSDNRWRDAVRLLEYGYSAFEFVPVAVAGQIQRTVRVTGGRERYLGLAAAETLTVPVPSDAAGQLVVSAAVAEAVRAPVAAETRLGTLTVAVAGRRLGSVALVAARTVARAAWWQMLLRWLGW